MRTISVILTLCLLFSSCTKENICYECKTYNDSLRVVNTITICNSDIDFNIVDSNGVGVPVVCQIK